MADNQTVPKRALIERLQTAVDSGESGCFSVLTDSKIPVLLVLDHGQVTKLGCRSLKPEDVLAVLSASAEFRYSFMPTAGDQSPALMPGEALLQRLKSGASPATGSASSSASNLAAGAANARALLTHKQALIDLTTEYIGMVAEIVVDEACEEHAELGQIIRMITKAIPEPKRAAEFNRVASEKFAKLLG